MLILSDSICGRVNINKLNESRKYAHAVKILYPGATPKDLEQKNPEEIGISFNHNNNNQINRSALLEQDVNSILSERKQNSPACILKKTGSDISGVEASNSDSICFQTIIEKEEDVLDPCNLLKRIRVSNINKLVIAQLNINNLRNKFEDLKVIILNNLDILIINESKLDNSFPTHQFFIEGYCTPLRLDHDSNGGGVIIYMRDDIPCKELKIYDIPKHFEGIFLKINLRKEKWILFGGYFPHKQNISNFLKQLSPLLDGYLSRFDNYLLIGDLNSEIQELALNEFCETYNLINEPTCYNNPLNPSSIDVMLTNRPNRFHASQTIEIGLSDHKLTVTVLKTFFQQQKPISIKHRDYKKFDQTKFHKQLEDELNAAEITKKSLKVSL